MVKVFFGCSMRGGHGKVSQDELRRIVDIIAELGYTLMSRHQTSQHFASEEAPLSNSDIHDRDYAWLLGTDVGVFELSNPSLGAGGEISDMVHNGKPVLCLYKQGIDNVSAYILGKQGSRYVKTPFICHAYSSLDEVRQLIRDFVQRYGPK